MLEAASRPCSSIMRPGRLLSSVFIMPATALASAPSTSSLMKSGFLSLKHGNQFVEALSFDADQVARFSRAGRVASDSDHAAAVVDAEADVVSGGSPPRSEESRSSAHERGPCWPGDKTRRWGSVRWHRPSRRRRPSGKARRIEAHVGADVVNRHARPHDALEVVEEALLMRAENGCIPGGRHPENLALCFDLAADQDRRGP